jgi:hypothetical protein
VGVTQSGSLALCPTSPIADPLGSTGGKTGSSDRPQHRLSLATLSLASTPRSSASARQAAPSFTQIRRTSPAVWRSPAGRPSRQEHGRSSSGSAPPSSASTKPGATSTPRSRTARRSSRRPRPADPPGARNSIVSASAATTLSVKGASGSASFTVRPVAGPLVLRYI